MDREDGESLVRTGFGRSSAAERGNAAASGGSPSLNGVMRSQAADGPASASSHDGGRREPVLWITWQHAAYIAALGVACMLVIPLTSAWWILAVLGVAMPLALTGLHALRRGRVCRCGWRFDAGEWAAGRRGPPEDAQLTPAPPEVPLDGKTEQTSAAALTRQAPERRLDDGSTPSWAHLDDGIASGDGAARSCDQSAEHHPAASEFAESLSVRELEVLRLLASGRTNSEAARELVVSVGTIKSHTGNIYRKLGARNRTQAVARARELGLSV